MKKCARCNTDKDPSEFRKDANRLDGLQSSCKACVSSGIKSVYTQRYGKKSRARVKKRIDENRKTLSDLKKSLGCKFCTELEPICLEFHHKNPKTKEFGIADYMACNIERLLRETKKCVCVCANCHKKVHAGLLKI